MNRYSHRPLVRYASGTRINHWIIAIGCVLLALSGHLRQRDWIWFREVTRGTQPK